MLIKRVLYKDWDKAQEDMREAIKTGFSAGYEYDPNEKGWVVTFKTFGGPL